MEEIVMMSVRQVALWERIVGGRSGLIGHDERLDIRLISIRAFDDKGTGDGRGGPRFVRDDKFG